MAETTALGERAGAVLAAPSPASATSPRARLRARRRLQVPPTVLVCMVVLALIALSSIAAPLLAPHDPLQQSLADRNLPPIWMGGSWEYPLGTDQVGYDLLSRTLYGSRPALTIGLIAAVISLSMGTALGLLAGYFGKFVDSVIMTIADAQLSTPFLVIAIAAVAAFGRSTLILIVLAGISGWMGFARTVRAQVLSLRQRDFILAGQALGATNGRILWRHLLPNLSSFIIVLVTIQMRTFILFEASLSFLGLGVPPPTPSWGSMIANGRDYLLTSWWISVIPGVALMLTVLCVSLIGDWLRDVLDPTLRGSR